MSITIKYIAKNFIEPTGSFSVQISQVAVDEFNFGVLKQGEQKTLFEEPDLVYLSKMTLSELIDLKKAMNNLIDRVEEAVKESL